MHQPNLKPWDELNEEEYLEQFKVVLDYFTKLNSEQNKAFTDSIDNYLILKPLLDSKKNRQVIEKSKLEKGLPHLLLFHHYSQKAKEILLEEEKFLRACNETIHNLNKEYKPTKFKKIEDRVTDFILYLEEEFKRLESIFVDYNIKLNLGNKLN